MPKGIKGKTTVCVEADCENTNLIGWGMCGKHYQRWWKAGKPPLDRAAEPWPDAKECSMCKEVKRLDEFYRQAPGGRYGRMTRCCACIRKEHADRRRANPVAAKQREARYRVGKEQERAARMRAYYWANAEKRKAYGRFYRQRNLDALKAKNAEWVKNNRERVSLDRAQRRALKRNAPGHCTPEQLKARNQRFGNQCWICHAPNASTVDHVKPLTKGGSNWPANLRPCCHSCNSRKRNRWLGVARLNELARTIRIERLNDALAALRTTP